MLHCIAIDDEPIALSIIQRYCERYGNISLETFSSPRAGMARIREAFPDIVFLDIEMNGTSGVELARELPEGCCLVFTTAYAHYALDGFEVNAVDFLHKPYFYDRFERAMQKAETWLRMHSLLASAQLPQRLLVLKSGYKNVTLPVDDIIYIEAMENYVKIYRASHPPFLSQISMRTMEEQLPPDTFLRVHRSYIVAKSFIASFTRTAITMAKTKKPIPIGRTYADHVVAVLENVPHTTPDTN